MPEGQRFVIVHEDHDGPMPEGTVVRTKSLFPLVFPRTQSFAFNADRLADGIRRQARIHGAWQAVDLPNVKAPRAVIRWTIEHATPYPETAELMKQAARTCTADVHKAAFDEIYGFPQTGKVTVSTGMVDRIDSPTGASHQVRAAGTLLGHLGFPTHHAYYQNIPVDPTGAVLDGETPYALTILYEPGVDLFWSITRYANDSRLPLDPADMGGHDIQSYNGFNTEPDADETVNIAFSREDPKDGTYWRPVTGPYSFIARYDGPTSRLNGNAVHDVMFGGTPLEDTFRANRF